MLKAGPLDPQHDFLIRVGILGVQEPILCNTSLFSLLRSPLGSLRAKTLLLRTTPNL